MTELDDLLALTLDIAHEAGALARKRRDEGVTIAATKSSLADIVTNADREVEDLVRARLRAERPDDGFYGEESGEAPGTSGLTWIVDPIDGTVNYAYGIPAYAVSIAVARTNDVGEHDAIVGVVFNPATGETFHAAAGAGAFLGEGANARRLHVNDEPDAAGLLIATGFGYAAERRREQFSVLEQVLPLARDIRRIGAASLDLAGVAAGRTDAYYERGLSPWDYAAGALLVREAGGVVVGRGGERESRELVLAGSAATVARLAPIVGG
ncbi:inositol monophosphatase family protein [uncultured Microbacterium sp.]|uniref:inositol monophosphatase family protein n=1 Tax=uncultured Microbacterium sp. TaxID=191216 RepID=UPI0025FBA680|nr:inositol monophosphatase family protein [uncultured Microbacterium sp.]